MFVITSDYHICKVFTRQTPNQRAHHSARHTGVFTAVGARNWRDDSALPTLSSFESPCLFYVGPPSLTWD